MNKPLTLTIIGLGGVGKDNFFRKISQLYSFNKKSPAKSLANNSENLISKSDFSFKIVDTPIFKFRLSNEIEKIIREKTDQTLARTDLIIWIIDDLNQEVGLLNRFLKKFSAKKIILFNKLKSLEEDLQIKKIVGEKIFLSITNKRERFDIFFKTLQKTLPLEKDDVNKEERNKLVLVNQNFPQLVIFGAPNSGKSTIMNNLLGTNISLVSSVAGTTKEAVEHSWNFAGNSFNLIDTAGITKEEKINERILRNCDLCWAVLDSSVTLSKQILQIVSLSEKYKKALLIIVNKIDLIEDKESFIEEIKNRLKSLSYAPIVPISALNQRGFNILVFSLKKMHKESTLKFSKRRLEKTFSDLVIANQPNIFNGGKLKIYFAKHENGWTHKFIIFVNNPNWLHFSYQRYMINYLRRELKINFLPINLFFKKSE